MSLRSALIFAAITTAATSHYPPALAAALDCRIESCTAGRSIWINYRSLEFCSSVVPRKCTQSSFGSKYTILGTENFEAIPYYRVRDASGNVGYLIEANSHLYSTVDPKPAVEAKKKAATEDAARREKQRAQDDLALKSDPGPHEKACVIAAASRLPQVPGLEIVKSDVLPAPDGTPRDLGMLYRTVNISVKAAGQEVLYSFFCGKGLSTPASVQILSQK